MRILILIISLSLTSCNTLYNVSRTDSFFKPNIGKVACARNHLVINYWDEDTVRYPELEQYKLDLYLSSSISQADFENYKNSRRLISQNPSVSEYFSVPKGTRMTIDKVYKSNVFAVGSKFIVLSTVHISALKGELVDISSLFESNDGLGLNQKYAEYCD